MAAKEQFSVAGMLLRGQRLPEPLTMAERQPPGDLGSDRVCRTGVSAGLPERAISDAVVMGRAMTTRCEAVEEGERCTPQASNPASHCDASGGIPSKTTWVDIRDLKADSFQTDGGWMVQYLARYLAKLKTSSMHSM